MDGRERAARLELVEFQLQELQKAALKPGEDEELAAQRQVLRSADTLQRLCAESYAQLYESEHSVLAGLGRVWKRVSELAAIDPRFSRYVEQRDAVKAELEDLAFALRDFNESIDTAPARLEQVEERLALLERLKRKHGAMLADVIAKRDLLAAEHAALTGGSSSPDAVEGELHAASSAFLEHARHLSARRRSAAEQFARALERELADLAMERTRFEVRLVSSEQTSHWSEDGIDAGEFYLSANVGEEARPLARIVSGGELSRVMLALKTLAAADTPGKTLIFDEVDAGIGGRVATVVGQKLRALGERFQVLCITHLPQIAAAGRVHFSIEKSVRGSRTVTSVTRLDAEARADEIARMIGGAAAGEQAKASARELLTGLQTASGDRGAGSREQVTGGERRKRAGERQAPRTGEQGSGTDVRRRGSRKRSREGE
jgi:DNA repair protein RecN (Recombination protein N)